MQDVLLLQVPGKSPQECYDKVYSGILTPPARTPRSRAKISDASACDSFLSPVTKLLTFSETNSRKRGCAKRRSQTAHKTVRKLLQKNFSLKDHGTDLFSVLEPNSDLSTRASEPSVLPSALEHVEDLTPVRKCDKTFSPGNILHLSSVKKAIDNEHFSPPVLKQVGNKALHEKYIDLLHNRDAKRKASSEKAKRSSRGKENKNVSNVPRIDLVTGAKFALISEAKDGSNRLKSLQANDTSSSSDFDNDLRTEEDEDGDES